MTSSRPNFVQVWREGNKFFPPEISISINCINVAFISSSKSSTVFKIRAIPVCTATGELFSAAENIERVSETTQTQKSETLDNRDVDQ